MIHRDLGRFRGLIVRVAVTCLVLAWFSALPSFAGTTTYTYDAQGRLSGVSVQTTGADVQNTTVTYDNADNRTALVYAFQDHTPPNPPTNLTATAQAYNSILLNWTTSLDVGGGPVAHYNIYRGGSLYTSTSSPPYNDQNVLSNTPYTYTASAVDPSGNESAQSAPASATTPPAPDLTPPSVPTSLQGAAVSGTQINLTWGGSTDTGGSGLAGYEIFRNNGGTPIGTSTVASYSDSSLTPYTTYLYTVRAYDGAGNRSGMSNQVSVTTPDTIPPSAPGSPTFSSIASTSATASWTAASDNAGVTGYRYSLNGGSSWTAVGAVLSVNLTGLTPGTLYTVWVEAGDAAGNWGGSSSGSFTTAPGYLTDNVALTDGATAGYNGYIPVYTEVGYAQGSFGTLTPTTTSNGFTISVLFTYTNFSTGQILTALEVTGFSTNPGSGWLQSITIPNIGTLNGASATFTYGSGTAEWEWTTTGAPSSGTVTIVHQ